MLIRRSEGNAKACLEIELYCNQLGLTTTDALYSYGDRYIPAVAAINYLEDFLPSIHNVLMLGTGLGSIVYVLERKGYQPNFTLVDIDKEVLEWAMEFLAPLNLSKTIPVCDDAAAFMEKNTAKYDFIFIDVFKGRVVPAFVYTPGFLLQCRNSLSPGGHVAFNYMVNDAVEWEVVRNVFIDIFPNNHIIKIDINVILIGG